MSTLVHRMFFGRHSPQPLEVVDVAAECLLSGVHVVVGDAKLTTGLGHNGRDLRIVGLDDTREEMVCGLMVEGTWMEGRGGEGDCSSCFSVSVCS